MSCQIDHAGEVPASIGKLEDSQIARANPRPRTTAESFIAEKRKAPDGEVTSAGLRREHVGEVHRKERNRKLVTIARGNATLDLPERFPVLLADPPWRYEAGTIDPTRQIDNQYPGMSLDEICALPVGAQATEDAILFLWHPPGMATEAVRVVTAWGFRERSSWVWIKPSIGPGYWGRLRHELVMIATRGDIPAPATEDRPDSVIEAPRKEHSAKPSAVHERIERMFPTLPKLELFARKARPGWRVWGNEAKGEV